MKNCTIFAPDKIDNPRIKSLVELSINLPPFDRRLDLIEMFDENTKLMDERKFCQSNFCATSLNHESQYIMLYYDGRLVEVVNNQLNAVVFRNITPACWQLVKRRQHNAGGFQPFKIPA